MKIAKIIQERLKKTDYGMAKEIGLKDVTAWKTYRDSKAQYLKPLIKLFDASGLTANQFIELLRNSIK